MCPQEEAQKVDRQAEEQENQKMAAAVWNFDGHPRRFREILSRRKKKKGERLSFHLSASTVIVSQNLTCPSQHQDFMLGGGM